VGCVLPLHFASDSSVHSVSEDEDYTSSAAGSTNSERFKPQRTYFETLQTFQRSEEIANAKLV
jgi:hypothetical protein